MAIVCTGMFYLTISLHIHGRPVGFIFKCRFAATPKSESDRRGSVLFLRVALWRHRSNGASCQTVWPELLDIGTWSLTLTRHENVGFGLAKVDWPIQQRAVHQFCHSLHTLRQ